MSQFPNHPDPREDDDDLTFDDDEWQDLEGDTHLPHNAENVNHLISLSRRGYYK